MDRWMTGWSWMELDEMVKGEAEKSPIGFFKRFFFGGENKNSICGDEIT